MTLYWCADFSQFFEHHKQGSSPQSGDCFTIFVWCCQFGTRDEWIQIRIWIQTSWIWIRIQEKKGGFGFGFKKNSGFGFGLGSEVPGFAHH